MLRCASLPRAWSRSVLRACPTCSTARARRSRNGVKVQPKPDETWSQAELELLKWVGDGLALAVLALGALGVVRSLTAVAVLTPLTSAVIDQPSPCPSSSRVGSRLCSLACDFPVLWIAAHLNHAAPKGCLSREEGGKYLLARAAPGKSQASYAPNFSADSAHGLGGDLRRTWFFPDGGGSSGCAVRFRSVPGEPHRHRRRCRSGHPRPAGGGGVPVDGAAFDAGPCASPRRGDLRGPGQPVARRPRGPCGSSRRSAG